MTMHPSNRLQTDIIHDMIRHIEPLLQAAMSEHERQHALARLERTLRATWGGERHYVPQTRVAGTHERVLRVLSAWQQGRALTWIARAEGVTERRVRQIVAAGRQKK